MRVRVTYNALGNLEEIYTYIALVNYQPQNAEYVVNKIARMFSGAIASHPKAFRECEELTTKTKMYRKAICLDFWVVYRITAFEIIILGVTHSSRHPKEIYKLRRVK